MSEPLRLVTATDSSPAHADALSFEGFFESEKAGLCGALCLITRNRHEAEEITQDTFVRILERWDRVGTLSRERRAHFPIRRKTPPGARCCGSSWTGSLRDG